MGLKRKQTTDLSPNITVIKLSIYKLNIPIKAKKIIRLGKNKYTD